MSGKLRSDIRKRPPAPPKTNPAEVLFSPAKYFSEPHMVVRRGELQIMIASLERARRLKHPLRRLWRWLSAPFVTPVLPPEVKAALSQEQAPKRGRFDASGKAIDEAAADLKEQAEQAEQAGPGSTYVVKKKDLITPATR